MRKMFFGTIIFVLLFGMGRLASALYYNELFINPYHGQVLGASTTGLVGYWNFDEGSGTTAGDSSGYGNNGSITSAAWAAGKVGSGALSFDGSVSKVTVGHSASLDNLSSFTYAAWVDPTMNDWNPIISKGYGSSASRGFMQYFGSSYSLVNTDGTSAQSSAATSMIPLNQWTHVVVTYDNSGDRKTHIYINGMEVPSYSSQTRAATGNLTNDSAVDLLIGNNNSFSFHGLLDEVRVYNRALSASEITDVYNDQGGTGVPPTGPSVTSFTASSPITVGQTATLTWATANATSVTISPSLGTVAASGSTTVSPTVTTTYTLTATNGASSVTSTATVTVNSSGDSSSPSVPTNLTATAISSSQINLSWTASSDNVAVTGYKIYRGGAQIDSAAGTSYNNTGLTAATSYSYTVAAYDAAGNTSAQSTAASATTQASQPAQVSPTITSFTASANTVASGQAVTLSWAVTGTPAPAVTISGIGAVSGTQATVNPTQTTTYTLTATNSAGSASSQLTVNVSSVSQATAGAPILFFSDIESGPKTGGENGKGAYVCVFGRNFGSSQGTITVGGGQVNNIKVWSDEGSASHRPASSKACFQLGANAQTGNIVVTNSVGSSNGLPFTVRSAGTNPDGIWCVAPTSDPLYPGSDSKNGHFSNNGASGTGCKATWAAVKSAGFAAGDIVYLLGPVATGIEPDYSDGSVAWYKLPGGNTNPNMPQAFLGYPGRTFELGDNLTTSKIIDVGNQTTAAAYWTVANLSLRCNGSHSCLSQDLTGRATGPQNMHHDNRYINIKVQAPGMDMSNTGAFGFVDGSNLKVYGIELTNIGCGFGMTGGPDDNIVQQPEQLRCGTQSPAGVTITSVGTTVTVNSTGAGYITVGAHVLYGGEEKIVTAFNNLNNTFTIDSPFSSNITTPSAFQVINKGPFVYAHSMYPGGMLHDVDIGWVWLHNNSVYKGISQNPNYVGNGFVASTVPNSEPGTGAAKVTLVGTCSNPGNYGPGIPCNSGDPVSISDHDNTGTILPAGYDASVVGSLYMKVIDQSSFYLYQDAGLTIPVKGTTACSNSKCGYYAHGVLGAWNYQVHDSYIERQNGTAVANAAFNPNRGYFRVFNNIFAHTGQGPAIITKPPSMINLSFGSSFDQAGMQAGTVEIYNNTFYDLDNWNTLDRSDSIPYWYGGAIANGYNYGKITFNFNNNILYSGNSSRGLMALTYSENYTGSKNILYGGTTNADYGYPATPSVYTSSAVACPGNCDLFTNAANGDFSLKAGSVAIGSGVDLGLGTNIGANWSRVASASSPSPVFAPTIASFSASPASIASGGSTTLSWSVSNASSLSIDQSVGSVTGLSSKTVSPSQTTTYTLTATGSGGTTTKTVTVTITALLPIISNLVGSNATASSTQLSWNTNIPTNGQVAYGTTTAYGLLSALVDDSSKTTTHAVTLTNLVSATLYHFKVTATDALGNSTSTPDFTFTTLQSVSSTTSPSSSPGSNPSNPGSPSGGGPVIPLTPPPVTVYIPSSTPVSSLPVTPPASQPGTNPSGSLSVIPSQFSSNTIKLVNISGTYYVIANGQRRGITNPAMLYSYGLKLKDAKIATAEEKTLPEGGLILPNNGALVKSKEDPTVYLVSQGQRYGFVSAKVFRALGFQFNSVLTVTNPELQTLPLSLDLVNDPAKPHLPGVNIKIGKTIYWIGLDFALHPYPSLAVFNSWNLAEDINKVLPANSADKKLPVGEAEIMRIK